MVLDAISEVELFVDVFASVYVLALVAYILTSWIQLPYSLRSVQGFLRDVCEPYLRVWRRMLPFAMGPFDFSPMVGILAIFAATEIINAILNRL